MRRAPDSLNPYLSTRLEGELIAYRQYPKLFTELPHQSPGMPPLKPNLVARYQWEEGQRKLVLFLKEGLAWSDGVPLTSADVAYTLGVQKNVDLAWVSRDRKATIESWQIVDDHTLAIHFNRTSAFNLLDLNEGVILPKHFYDQWPAKAWVDLDWNRELVVYGPYKVATWAPDERLVLESLVPAKYPTLGFAFVRDRDALFRLVENGELDYAYGLPVARIPQLKQLAKPIIFPDLTFAFIGWNPLEPSAFEEAQPQTIADLQQLLQQRAHPIFGNQVVRTAMAHAIRRHDHLEKYWHGNSTLPANPWQAGLPYRMATHQPRIYDPELADQLLRQAGWISANGVRQREGIPFKFSVICNSGSPIREAYLLAIQKDLGELGIQMEIEMMEGGLYIQACAARKFDAMFGSFRTGTRPDLASLYSDEAAVGGYNFCSWTGQDQLLNDVHMAADGSALEQALAALEKGFYRDQPLTMLYRGMNIGASARTDLQVRANALDYLFDISHWLPSSNP